MSDSDDNPIPTIAGTDGPQQAHDTPQGPGAMLRNLAQLRACKAQNSCPSMSMGLISKSARTTPLMNCLCQPVLDDILNVLGRRLGCLFRAHHDATKFDVIFEGAADDERARILNILEREETKRDLTASHATLLINGNHDDAGHAGHPLSRLPFAHILAHPVHVEGECMGWAILMDHDREFTREDDLMLRLLVSDIASNMRQAALLGELNARNLLLEKDKAAQQGLLKKLQEAQDQLLQSEKMASIGQLAAGVAHEINNPVGYVNSNISSMEGYIADLFGLLDEYAQCEDHLPEQRRQHLHEMKQRIDVEFLRDDVKNLLAESQEGMNRIRKIVQDLKDFSHVREEEWAEADLHQGLDSTLNIVHNELKYKATVVKEYGALPPVMCVGSQLNQVFMNMLVNASHAIEQRGTITIRTGTQGDDWVWVSIADTGKGISRENLQRIFDPFFTTKPVGQGTGLGLSLSLNIVSKHHGRIEVDSEPGRGTTFTIRLPVRQPAQDESYAI